LLKLKADRIHQQLTTAEKKTKATNHEAARAAALRKRGKDAFKTARQPWRYHISLQQYRAKRKKWIEDLNDARIATCDQIIELQKLEGREEKKAMGRSRADT